LQLVQVRTRAPSTAYRSFFAESRGRGIRAVLLAVVGFVLRTAGATSAQDYPVRPVTWIVPFGAIGPVDRLARLVSEPTRVSLGQRVLIEDVTGASGTIGVARVARAAPDGYTVSIGNRPTHVVNGAKFTLPYDLLTDCEPVTRLSGNPYVVVSRKDLRAQNLNDLIDWLKANPGKGSLGIAGPGSGQHLCGVYFQGVLGTSFNFVSYRAGSSQMMQDLVGGHADLTFDQAISSPNRDPVQLIRLSRLMA
jgi:tripartite-type tricarboxylate transporter receptor subunit TctC